MQLQNFRYDTLGTANISPNDRNLGKVVRVMFAKQLLDLVDNFDHARFHKFT